MYGSRGYYTSYYGMELKNFMNLGTASAALAFLGDEAGSALAGIESAASGSALAIVGTVASDELSAWALAGRTDTLASACSGSSRGSSSSSTSGVEDLTNLEVGAASVDAGVGSDEGRRGGAQPLGDGSASITGLDGSRASSSSTSSGSCGGGGLAGSGDTGSAGSVGSLDGDRSAVVGGSLSEAASSITGLGNDCAGALSGGESAAVRDTVKVLGARTSDELVAVGDTGKDGRRGDESESSDDKSGAHYD